MELMLACDLVWAASSARFSQAEASIGTTTLLGGLQRLGRTRRSDPRPRDYLQRRSVRCGHIREVEHREPCRTR
jgi:hypothetical protein